MRHFNCINYLKISTILLLLLLGSASSAQNLVALCKPITVYLDENGTAFVTPQDADDGSVTASGGQPVLRLSVSNIDCSILGTNTYILEAYDLV